MSNANSFLGYQNLPAQLIATTTDTPLLVPAQGLYSTLPSPTLTTGAGLYVGLTGDVLNNATYDGHPFTVRVAGKINVAVTNAFNVTLKLGTSATSATNTTIALATATAAGLAAGAYNFWFSVEFMWDSVSQTLNGVVSGTVAGTLKALVATTALQVVNPTATTTPTFNFIPSFQFATTANAANSVTVTEFLIDRGV
jgi:hypothetical protein